MNNGMSLYDIENSSFETLISVACSAPKKEKQKEVPLDDFIKKL